MDHEAKPHRCPDVLVLGGGIVGLACADALVRRGLSCTVIDRGDPGAASWASAGMIAPLAEVPDAEHFFAICRQARDLWPAWAVDLEQATGLDVDYDGSGALILDEDGWSARLAAAAAAHCEPAEPVSPAAARRLVPDLAEDAHADLRLGGEHRVDNRKVCGALRHRLAAAGVPIHDHTGVEEVAIEPGGRGVRVKTTEGPLSAGAAVVALGAWTSRQLLAGVAGDLELPVRPLRGQMLSLEGVQWPFLGSIRGRHLYAVRRSGDRLLVGATEDDVGFAPHTTATGLGCLLDWLRRVFPGLAELPVTETWAGLRPTTPDGRPLIGPIDGGGPVWLAAGHHRNGVLLTPWTARTLADWLVDGRAPTPEATSLFSVDRFSRVTT